MSFLDSRRVRLVLALVAGLLPMAASANIGALDFYTLTSVPPCRILDTRLSPPSLQAGTPRTISMVGGACGVPANAAAVALNVTALTPTTNGDVSLYPSGVSVPVPANPPSIASLPYRTGLNRAKQLLIELGPAGDVVASASAGQLDLVIDVAGYFLGAKAVADSQTVNEDAAATTISVLANDLNPNGDTLTIASATDPANGTVVIAGDNLSLTYQPDPNYCNNPPGTAPDTFTYTINPSGSTATVSITVDCQNDAPVVTTTGGSTAFTENGGAVVVDSGVTVTDVDSANLASATVTITNPQDGASEVLAATACAGLTVTPGLNTLSITGSQPPATYQTCLQSVTYDNSSSNPGTTARVISFVANDGTSSSAAANKTVTVAAVANAPVVTTTGGSTAFTEDGGAVVVDSGVTVTDPDSANLASATVTITNPQDGASEVLAATACAGLTVTPGLNTLSITGSQPLATYQTCLQSVTYNNSSQNPGTTARVISFVANDGTSNSVAATKTVTVAAVADAPVVTTTGGTTAFTEDGGAVVVDSGVTVTDPDSANLASASVTITNPQDGASEVLAATACAGLTVTPGLNTLSITGSQPPATYQTCLRSVTYDNTSQNPGTTARVISFVANDGALSSTPANKTVTVAAAADAPVVTTTAGSTAFTEDGGAVVVDSGVTVTDVDSTNLASATVTITNPQDGASEVLAASACAGLTVTPGLNVLNISGSQPVATYQTCLQSVTYDNTSQNPGTTARVVSFVANDGSASSTPATKTVTVAAVADAPVVTTTGGTTAFTEDGGAVVVDSGVTVTDPDSANLASATVTITNPQDGASEVLAASACAGLTVTPGLNTLSITGSQPPATYQTCLRSVTYNNTSQNPGTTARVLSFVANDGALSSTPANKTVSVAAVADAPVVTTTGGTTGFTEDGGAVVVDSGVTVTDADSTNLASATVTITNPQDGASEVLSASACVGLTVTPGLNTLSITGSQPVATYQTCLRSVAYNNSSQNPGTTPRVISFVANDGAVSSTPATKTVTVTSVPDAPVVTTTIGSTSFTEGGGAVVIDSGVTVTDIDSANLASATVTITNPQDGASEVLAASACAGLTVTPGLNTLSITGSQSLATYQTCLRSVAYNNSSGNPNTTARTISFVANDGAVSSTPATKTVTVTALPDAPVVTTTGGTTSFTEDGGAVVVDSGVTVTDADSPNLASATVTITNPQNGASEVLSASACAGLTVTPGLNTLSITGSQPVATYQTCLQSVAYNNSSQNPGTTPRVISFVANDGALSSVAATKTVTVTSVPDAPVVTTTGGTTSFTEDGGAVVVDSGVTVTDVDSANLASATVTITNPQDGASEVLGASACAGLTVTPGLNSLSITGSQPVATYQTCLRSVTYNNSSQNPSAVTRTVSFVANDGSLSSVAVTKSVSVTPVPDPPVPTTSPVTYATAGNIQLHVAGKTLPGVAAIADPVSVATKAGPFIDPDGPVAATIVAASGATVNGGSYDIDTTGAFTYVPPVGFTGPDSFTYQITDSVVTGSGTVNVNVSSRVWFIRDLVDANNPAGGDGRSSNAFDTIAAFNAALTNDNDIIFVLRGTTGTTPLAGGLTLRNGQKLHGEGIGLTVPSFGTVVPAGLKPRISNAGGDAVSVPATGAGANRQSVEIRGLDLSGSANAVDVTASGTNLVGVTISDNDVSAAGVEGIDLNAGSTGAFTATLANNAIASTGNAFDARTSAATAMTIDFSNNAVVSGANGILIDGSGGGTATITGFANNAVSGNNVGTGMVITSAKFDATPGGTFQTVSGGTTVVGASGNGVGAAGVVMTNVSGDLSFTDLDVFADSGAGLRASGTTPYTGSAGFQIAVGSGVATVTANGGPAVDLTTVTASLPFQQITSTSSATTGVALNSLLGSFSAGSGSSITGTSGTGFQVGSSNATISYAGTINTTTGKGVDLTSNAGSTISFTGTMTLSSGTNTAFNATSSGTVTATDTASTLISTTGTALNVANTTIGASGLKFRSISSNGAASGIVLNNTGASGSLSVLGTGSANSGGTIQNTTSHGISLTSTLSPSFNWMNIQSTAASGVKGTQVTNFTFTNGTINNSGTGGGTNESNIAFNIGAAGTETNLTGTVSITGNSLTNARWHGVDITNFNGTIASADISNNTVTSSTSVATSLGSGIQFLAQGSATTLANITKATITNNIISNFPSGAGINIGGGSTATASSITLGIPSSANAITITGNRIQGASNVNRMGTNAIIATINSCNGQSNFIISNNGTVANPVTNIAGVVISHFVGGNINSEATINGNVLVSNNTAGSSGIGVQVDQACAATDAAVSTMTVNSNSVSSNDGSGIRGLVRNSNGTLNLKVQNNTVTAPLTANRNGIRVDSGSAVGNTTLCLNMTGNTSAGSGVNQGLGIRKQGTVAGTNSYGINGLAPSPATAAQAQSKVNTDNPAGGGTDVVSGDNFVTCSLP
jgi:hypothetical protein